MAKRSKQIHSYRVFETKQFRKDVKSLITSGRYNEQKLRNTVRILARGEKLPFRYHDHALKGSMQGFRECHIEPDWLLVYRYQEDRLVLVLQRTGSHSKLFVR